MSRFITCKARFKDDNEVDLSELGLTNYDINWHWGDFAFDLNKVVGCNPTKENDATTIWFINGDSWIIDILFDDLIKQL